MLTKLSNPTVGEIIEDRSRMPLGAGPTTRSLVQAYRIGEQRAHSAANELQHVLRNLGTNPTWNLPTDLVPAEIGTRDRDDARMMLAERHQASIEQIEAKFLRGLEEASEANLVGRIQWVGDRACRFHYFDKERDRTLTKLRTRTIKHTHDLVDARRVRLPATSVKRPRRCQAIIRSLPPWLAKHCYIVTGSQIVADVEQVAETEAPNEVVVATRWLGKKLRRGAKAVAKGTAVAASVPLALSTAVLSDPALVVGDFVLYGWEG